MNEARTKLTVKFIEDSTLLQTEYQDDEYTGERNDPKKTEKQKRKKWIKKPMKGGHILTGSRRKEKTPAFSSIDCICLFGL